MTRYFAKPYSYQPARFWVAELDGHWNDGEIHITNPDGIEIVLACDYDELCRAYDHVYESLMEMLKA